MMIEKQSDTTDQRVKQDTEALLLNILTTIEKDRQRGGLELAIAIILSLATLCSTWCGYQASLWSGVQSAKQTEASTTEHRAGEEMIIAFQERTFDGMTVLAYWAALRENDEETAKAIFARMRPAMRAATEASIAAGVLHDPTVAGPLQRPEYVLPEQINSKALRAKAIKLNDESQIAGQISGSYVSLTLMFASVLFFGGITGTFTSRRVRIGLGVIALSLFMVTLTFLLRLPVAMG